MPVHKVKGGYQWGETGKVYKGRDAKKKAIKQAIAIAYSEAERRGKDKPSQEDITKTIKGEEITKEANMNYPIRNTMSYLQKRASARMQKQAGIEDAIKAEKLRMESNPDYFDKLGPIGGAIGGGVVGAGAGVGGAYLIAKYLLKKKLSGAAMLGAGLAGAGLGASAGYLGGKALDKYHRGATSRANIAQLQRSIKIPIEEGKERTADGSTVLEQYLDPVTGKVWQVQDATTAGWYGNGGQDYEDTNRHLAEQSL